MDGSLRSTCPSREEIDAQDATPVHRRVPRTRRRFTGEFKAEAVRLLEESGRPLQAVAEELGVHANQLRGWRNEHLAAGSAEALARQKAEAAELARLRREVKRLEQENEILRRAAAFFAREAVPS